MSPVGTPGQDEWSHGGPDLREWALGLPVGFRTGHQGPETWHMGSPRPRRMEIRATGEKALGTGGGCISPRAPKDGQAVDKGVDKGVDDEGVRDGGRR